MEILKKEEAIIKHFENVISGYKFDIVHIFVLYNMMCHENYNKLKEIEKHKLMNKIYNFYIKDEQDIDIGKISDTVMEHYKEILNNNINYIYNYI